MKKILILFVLVLTMGCSNTSAPVPDVKLKTYLVTTSEMQDTIVAEHLTSGNYSGLGRAVLFFEGEVVVGVALIPEDRKLTVKTLKP